MIGTVLGNYKIVAKIGAGGMGVVWLGEHQLLGSHVAIKVLLSEISAQPKLVERFFDEARAASRIQDPGIITVHDFGRHEGCAYIVMEHLKGEPLNARLGMGKLPELTAVRIIQQCAIAMAAAHARGIIHRDLKPDNIYLIADHAVPGGERIKILDFGIAKLIDDSPSGSHASTVTGTIMGTPAYMSPEQCRGAGAVDHRTDIYALGCVLFQLLCGRPPFIAPTPGDMIASHLRQDPPVPSALVPELSTAVDALVARCLAKEPDRRFATMTELVRAAAAITNEHRSIATLPPRRASSTDGGETVATMAPQQPTTLQQGTGEASTTAPPRRTWPLVAGAAVVVGAIVVAFVIAGSGPSPRPPAPPVVSPPASLDARLVPDAAVDAATPVDAARPDARTIARPRDAGAAHDHAPGSGSADPYGSR